MPQHSTPGERCSCLRSSASVPLSRRHTRTRPAASSLSISAHALRRDIVMHAAARNRQRQVRHARRTLFPSPTCVLPSPTSLAILLVTTTPPSTSSMRAPACTLRTSHARAGGGAPQDAVPRYVRWGVKQRRGHPRPGALDPRLRVIDAALHRGHTAHATTTLSDTRSGTALNRCE